jgi:hypothetical protein
MHKPAKPPFPKQKQSMPGKTDAMEPVPDHGESGRLAGKKAIITGADSGIGRAVAIAYAREGTDVLIAYLNEHDDARQTERLVKEAGRKAVRVAGKGPCKPVAPDLPELKAVHDTVRSHRARPALCPQ